MCYWMRMWLGGPALAMILAATCTMGQQIEIGTWRSHLCYRDVISVAQGGGKVFGATPQGIVVFDPDDESLVTYSKINGLSSGTITSLSYDAARDQLLVGFQDATINMIKDQKLTVYRALAETQIEGPRMVHHIGISSNVAFLSCDFGVVVFDLERREVRETFRDIGSSGEQLAVYQSAVVGDSIFLATGHGVLAGNLNDNLLDFRSWSRFDTGILNDTVQGISRFGGSIYAAVNGVGLLKHTGGGFSLTPFPGEQIFKDLAASDQHLLICTSTQLWTLDTTDKFDQVVHALISSPSHCMEDTQGSIWLGDRMNGLLSNRSGVFAPYVPNGPPFPVAPQMCVHRSVIYAVSGGWDEAFMPLGHAAVAGAFENGHWDTLQYRGADLSGIATDGYRIMVGTFGSGLEVREHSTTTIYDETNSPLENIASPANGVLVTALTVAVGDTWVANFGAAQPLHVLHPDQSWESFTFPENASHYPVALMRDSRGYLWMPLRPAAGGGMIVFDPATNRSNYLTDASNSGGLPSRSVNTVAEDHEGQIWVGTGKGVALFTPGQPIFDGPVQAIRPVFESQYLLQSSRVNDIVVDGANDKWIATDAGLWLFSADADEVIYHFTTSNSPLTSNNILCLAMIMTTGELFVSTDLGIHSFRSGATGATASFSDVKIFPNPVTAEFTGIVGISGLAQNAFVRITDIRGKVIWSGQASGGTATWNVRNQNGNRPGTGIYLVFMAAYDGSESMVGKIAVIN